MLDFSRNSDHLYRLYITGDMMLRDGLEDIRAVTPTWTLV
jgi:hypothetical protein